MGKDNHTTVRSGNVRIKIIGGQSDGFKIDKETFTLTRGEQIVVKITRDTTNQAPPASVVAKAIKGIEQLPKGKYPIRDVNLSNTEVTDESLGRLRDCPSLDYLALSGTDVSDAGLEHLAQLQNLEVLILDLTSVTDAGLERLVELTNLRTLYVSDAQITDAGLVHLKGLTNLQTLGLARQAQTDADKFMYITDAGLAELHGLKGLKTLDLSGTAVTDAGVAALKAGLPGDEVTEGPWSVARTLAPAGKVVGTLRVACLKLHPAGNLFGGWFCSVNG